MNDDKKVVELNEQNISQTKLLLLLEWVLIIISLVSFLLMLFVSIELIEDLFWKIVLIVSASTILGLGIIFSILIEQKAGYYQCRNCNHKYIPTYMQVLWSMHFGRTRYMKCPKCNNRSWNKKVISK